MLLHFENDNLVQFYGDNTEMDGYQRVVLIYWDLLLSQLFLDSFI